MSAGGRPRRGVGRTIRLSYALHSIHEENTSAWEPGHIAYNTPLHPNYLAQRPPGRAGNHHSAHRHSHPDTGQCSWAGSPSSPPSNHARMWDACPPCRHDWQVTYAFSSPSPLLSLSSGSTWSKPVSSAYSSEQESGSADGRLCRMRACLRWPGEPRIVIQARCLDNYLGMAQACHRRLWQGSDSYSGTVPGELSENYPKTYQAVLSRPPASSHAGRCAAVLDRRFRNTG